LSQSTSYLKPKMDMLVKVSDVKSAWPKSWPQVQNFGLGLNLKDLASASASKDWPQPQTFGLNLASISLSYYVIRHFSCKNRLKFRKFVNFSGNNLKSYVVNHYLVLFIIIFCLGLNLQKLASAS